MTFITSFTCKILFFNHYSKYTKFHDIYVYLRIHYSIQCVLYNMCYLTRLHRYILILSFIMLSVIFPLYIRYTTILAYCTDIREISLFLVYTVPRRGIEPGASWLHVESATDWVNINYYINNIITSYLYVNIS